MNIEGLSFQVPNSHSYDLWESYPVNSFEATTGEVAMNIGQSLNYSNILGNNQPIVSPSIDIINESVPMFPYHDLESMMVVEKPIQEEMHFANGSTSEEEIINIEENIEPMFIKNREVKQQRTKNIVKGQWTGQEDRLLVKLVEQYGVKRWSFIAQRMKGRIGKQCRERWYNHLKPDIKKETWTEEEDTILIAIHKELGNKWSEIAKHIHGRTENSIKNHWNATKRRQLAHRRSRAKKDRETNTLLEDYIKGLSLEEDPESSEQIMEITSPVDASAVPQQVMAMSNLDELSSFILEDKTLSHMSCSDILGSNDGQLLLGEETIPNFNMVLGAKMHEFALCGNMVTEMNDTEMWPQLTAMYGSYIGNNTGIRNDGSCGNNSFSYPNL